MKENMENRSDIRENMEDKSSFAADMVGAVDNEDFLKVKNNKDFLSVGNIQSMQPKYANLPLKEYCIKSAYNAATSGKTVNKNMVKFLLSRGCRLLDFEVFYNKKGDSFEPVVAESTDPEFKIYDTENSVPLQNIFSTAVSNAFSGNSPNKKDPLFIHLRIKTKDTQCYAEVAKLIDSVLKPKLYDGNIDRDTKLSELMGKVVIIIDKTIHRDYKEYAKCKGTDVSCYDLSNYLNIESGSQTINLVGLMQLENQAANPPLIKDDNVSTTAISSKLVLPYQKANVNPDMKKMILNYGGQMIGYRYHLVDENLMDCETFFNDNKGGIVPLAAAIPYFERVQKELSRKK
uniref:Phosphatidylinositol-specific phospholipase C X domain-containing protein n=1 Tax=viral metagenome TaxID=1070528 RepID=A0A6C0IP29_9ZZZZ